MTRVTALLDANVLYPAPLRDIVLQLAVEDVFRAKWTNDIHREWIDALLRHEPRRSRAALERTRDLMDQATRDCLVAGYETLISGLSLPDPDDRHVLAAAITARCDVIVTSNLRDFPQAAVTPHGIEVQHPDDFLSSRLDLMPGLFCEAVGRFEHGSWHRPSAFKTISPPSPDRDSSPPPPDWPHSRPSSETAEQTSIE